MRSGEGSEQVQFLAELLRTQAREIGMDAARRLLATGGEHANPVAAQAWRGELSAWADTLAGRIGDLSGAISAGRSEMFAEQIAWAVVAFRARGQPIEALARGLWSLREAVVRSVPDEDHELVNRCFDAAEQRLAGGVGGKIGEGIADPPGELTHPTPARELATRYLLHILEGDRRSACTVVTRAILEGRLTARSANRDVFTPVLRETGRLWHTGDITIAEEHFVTSTTLMAMSQVLAMATPTAANGRTMVAACVAGNTHEVGVRMVADTFELHGWRAVYLGPSVPAEDLGLAVRDYRADVVALSVTLPTHLLALRDATREIRGARPEVKILAGGPALGAVEQAERVAREHGADALGRDPEEAERLGRSLCGIA